MRCLKHLFVGLLALLILAMVAVYLTPLDAYVPEVEQVLSDQLHEPVSIRHIRIAVMPLPHLELHEVRLGDQKKIVIQSVDVELDLPGLLAGNILLRRIMVKDGTAHFELVRKLVDLLAKNPVTVQLVAVRELQFSGMNLLVPGMTLGPVEGKLEFTQTGQLERAWFAMDGQKVTAILRPLPPQPDLPVNVSQPGLHFAVQMLARGWIPSQFQQFPQIPLDDLQIDGVLGEQDFVAQKFVIASRGMRMVGSGRVEFSDGWRIHATLMRVDATLEQLMALLGKPLELTGALSVKGELSGKASTLSELKENFYFSGNVNARHVAARIAADFQHPLIFDQISMRVVAQPDRLELSSLEAKLYGGKLSGAASIKRKPTMLAADVAMIGISMQPLVEALTNEMLFAGIMESSAKFSIRLDSLKRFPENFQLAGNFHLRDGVLTKIDLARVTSNLSKANANGSETRFDDLSGLLNVDGSGYHFRKLKIKSGSLNAEGKVDVTPSLRISGMLDADVKGTAGFVSMPMVVSGTLNDPVVSPSGAAMTGAAVGTVILGPGFGTAVGVKVGGILNKLFGGNDGDKDDPKNGNSSTKNTKGTK